MNVASDAREPRTVGAGVWVLILAIVVTFLGTWRLASRPLENRDEGIHASVSLEMVRSGDWMTPTFAGEPYFRKPPLKIWITALLFEIGVPDALAIRLPSAVAGILVAVLVGIWMAQWRGPTIAAYVAGVAVISMRPAHLHAFRTGEMDGLLTLFVTSALYSWWRATRTERSSRFWIVSFGVCLGLGFMTKAIPGLLPLPVAALHCFLLPRERRPSLRGWISAIAACLVIAAPWHAWMTVEHGAAFWNRYVGVEVVDRTLETHWGAPKGATWYLQHLPLFFYPWSVALAPAIVWWTVTAIRTRDSGIGSERHGGGFSIWLLLLWSVVGLAIVSAMKTKAQSYLLSFLPAALMLIISFLWVTRTVLSDRLSLGCYAAIAGCAAAWTPRAFLSAAAWKDLGAGPWAVFSNTWVLGAIGVVVWCVLMAMLRNTAPFLGKAVLLALFATSLVVHFLECTEERAQSPLVPLVSGIAPRPARVIGYRTRFHDQPAAWFGLLREPGLDPAITYDRAELERMLSDREGVVFVLAPEAEVFPPEASLAPVRLKAGYRLWRRAP